MHSSERWLGSEPNILTTSTNRKLLHPTEASKKRRESNIQRRLDKGKHRTKSNRASQSRSRAPVVNESLRKEASSSMPPKIEEDQLVDLIIEDKAAEETERVRARKEGGSAWNEDEPQHFV